MDLRSAIRTRRWRAGVVVVAALSLWVSLFTSSALRHQFSAAALPEPAAWTHVSSDTVSAVEHSQAPRNSATASHVHDANSWWASPINKKPFHSMWTTKHRPQAGTRLQSQPDRSELRASFVGIVFRSAGLHTSAPAGQCGDRELLILYCISRS